MGAELVCPLRTRRETIRLARRVAASFAPGQLLLLHGELGAGKTFFTRALLRALGLEAQEPVTSPTFTLVQEHALEDGPLLHADLYRLQGKPHEVSALGLRERRADGARVVVEWGAEHRHLLGPVDWELTLSRGAGVRGREARLFGPVELRVAEWGELRDLAPAAG